MKQRYFLCVLLGAIMIYYAIPQLSFDYQNISGIFSLSWLGFALLVIAGNLTAILSSPRKEKALRRRKPVKKQMRSY